MTDVRVDPAALLAHADTIDELRDRLAPTGLPVGFAPAGQDAVSAMAATSISAKAAAAANGLWLVWSELGRISGRLRANAMNYLAQEAISTAALSGAGAAGAAEPVTAPDVNAPAVAVPHVYPGSGAVTPEQFAQLLRSGAGASSPSQFGQAWNSHAAGVDGVIADLGSTRVALAGTWSGPASEGADGALGAAHNALTDHHGEVAAVGDAAAAHSAVYRTAVDNTPEPVQFVDWHQQLDSAVAANAQYPGVYTPAVLTAQQQLNDGYTQTGAAYGQYATDPTTGLPIDPASGLPIDPATGLPSDPGTSGDDAAAGQDPLSSGGAMLTGLLGGLVSAAGGAMGAVTQGLQQAVQMATQGVGELTKGIASAKQPSVGDLAGDAAGLDGGGGVGGSGEGGGGGGMVPAAATVTGSAPSAPAAPAVSYSGPGMAGPAAATEGAGMGGMPMMPMGGGAGGRAGGAKASTDPQGKRLLPPERPNTARVIGVTDTERVEAKRDRREQRLASAKAAGEAKEDTA